MSEYAERFAQNRIDFSVLPDLTDQDLTELGIVLGDRRKLLRAAAELSRTEISKSAGFPSGAERRQLTVMFCDLVGSTALSTRLDPEDLREIIGAYHRCCAATVEKSGGFIAKYMGDGVLIYFGYPQAQEDDAERAVHTGLALVEAVPRLIALDKSPLAVRVGIATGLVVVGDLLGSGEAQERGVVGETPNLAARLQGVAGPGMVVISDTVRRLIGGLFELQDLGERDLKGIAEKVRMWAPISVRSVESRFDALRTTAATSLVGRDSEFDFLTQRWGAAKRGKGQIVAVSGEAGIGKSRLTSALLDRVAAEPHNRLRYFCSPQHTDSAFHAFIGQLERGAGLLRQDAPSVRLDKFDALLTASSSSAEDVALLADLLSLQNDGRYPTFAFAPAQRRQKTLEAIVTQIIALARNDPVLMVFEDAHWSDPSSQQVLSLAIERLMSHRVLLIVTFRPEFVPSWTTAHVATLLLKRLPVKEVGSVIDHVAGSNHLPDDVREEIIERADGIPLFVEEMTKAVLEARTEPEARRTLAHAPATLRSVPTSLHASLMARLDRLGIAKEVAQIAAAIGREFAHDLLASVADKSPQELGTALDRLLTAGLLVGQGSPPHVTYMFNHALVQDAAYSTLLREPRRTLHARIADTLENNFPDLAERQPEVVARHFEEAGLIEKAAALAAKAGRRALARSALKEAAEHLARALSLLESFAGTAEHRREQIRLQIELSNALIHTKGHASPTTKASFEKARLLIESAQKQEEALDDPLLLFSVLYGFWVANRMAFKGDVACELADQFLNLAGKESTTAPRMIGHMMKGISMVLVGAPSEGRTHLDRTIALYDPAEHRTLATRFGHDVRMTAFCWRAFALWLLGYPDAADADMESALNDAREVEHAATSMFALSHVSLARILRKDFVIAGSLAEQLVTLGREKGSLYWESYGKVLQGWLLAQAGDTDQAISLGTDAVAAIRSTGATAYAPWYMSFLADGYAKLGRFDDAWRCIDDAINATVSTGEKWLEAEIYRIAADVVLMSSDKEVVKAETYLMHAISIAREQKAASLELRIATSIACLWGSQGKRAEALNLLAPVCERFTEGLQTADMADARSLLKSLG
jgi:class 3 adenylate cyclase/predicted ATPase